MPRPPDALFVHPALYVKPCEFGMGVFSEICLPPDTLLEECHWVRFRADECVSRAINDYSFMVAEDFAEAADHQGWRAFLLGFGSIYNHSDFPNAQYFFDPERQIYFFQSTRTIEAHEQIFISYGSEWWSSRNLQPGATSD